MKRVPDQVECGNLVGKKFHPEECNGCADDPPVCQQLKLIGQDDYAGVSEQAKSGHGCVDVEAGSEGDGDDERHEFMAGKRELHGSSIGR